MSNYTAQQEDSDRIVAEIDLHSLYDTGPLHFSVHHACSIRLRQKTNHQSAIPLFEAESLHALHSMAGVLRP